MFKIGTLLVFLVTFHFVDHQEMQAGSVFRFYQLY